MKKYNIIGLTQHIIGSSAGIRRDVLSQNWTDFLTPLDFFVVPIPNKTKNIEEYIKETNITAVILTGGSGPRFLPHEDSNIHDRDAIEYELIKICSENNIPLVGICRGFQLLNLYFGGDIQPSSGHNNSTHVVRNDQQLFAVNSYHNWIITPDILAKNLTPVYFDEQGNVECAKHNKHPITGFMWHLEREEIYIKRDQDLLLDALKI